MSVPGELHALLERFERDRASYRSGQYNEAQARVDFINPLLGLLGWDVENRGGRPEAYRDVVYEDRVKVGGGTKAPDYGFYAGGRRRFFLEAKKPSVDIAGDVAPAVQLRRYAWSARLPLSVLTDFEEFAIYDCRAEPEKNDSATTAWLELFTYDHYAEEAVWSRISSVFSREAVLEGSLERYAEENRKRRGTQTVDAAFLREIEGWRSALAQDIALRNDLNTRQLNYAVQMTIDRIIFLRMAEDRGIEGYGRLMALLNGGDTYRRLCEVFRDADDRYNSGLFHFRGERGRDEEPDRLTLAIEIDDGVLKGIIRGLYYPESPYEFSVLPVDVLGQVYEQFLGKVIRLEDGHTATVEEKPEVRKAGGVYYTPTYIVDYIVEKTVGKLLEGKRPGPRGGASRLKIVDPACGSGSFLIGAYNFPLGYEYLDRYRDELRDKRIRQKTNPKYWYSCHRSRDMRVFETDRIITPEISLGCNMTLGPAGMYHNTMVYSLVPSSRQSENLTYWLGLLNSRLMWWFLYNTGNVLRGGYFRFKTNYLNPFPTRTLDFYDTQDVKRHDQMVGLVERMLSLHERLAEARIDRERTVIGHQISATDRQIDGLVYELYGLTDEEISIVEEATER